MNTLSNKFALLIACTTVLLLSAPVRAEVGDVEHWTGHGTAYDANSVAIKTNYLIETVVVEIAESVFDVTTTATFPNGQTNTSHCVQTSSDSGKSSIQCDDGTGESIRIRNLIQRVLHKDDGTMTSTAIRVGHHDAHRESIRTRFAAGGAVIGYNREAIDVID